MFALMALPLAPGTTFAKGFMKIDVDLNVNVVCDNNNKRLISVVNNL